MVLKPEVSFRPLFCAELSLFSIGTLERNGKLMCRKEENMCACTFISLTEFSSPPVLLTSVVLSLGRVQSSLVSCPRSLAATPPSGGRTRRQEQHHQEDKDTVPGSQSCAPSFSFHDGFLSLFHFFSYSNYRRSYFLSSPTSKISLYFSPPTPIAF